MTDEVRRALGAFEHTGSAHDARRLLEVVHSTPDFTAETPWYWQAHRLLSQDRWDETIRLLEGSMPSAFMSPDAHIMLAYAYGEVGESGRQDEQTALAHTAISAIAATGGGTRNSPWHVLRVIDEYAYLAECGFRWTGQRLYSEGASTFDIVALDDGSERWFKGRWFDGAL